VGVTQPRTGAFLPPRPLDRSAVPIQPGEDPRVRLAEWITDPRNEYFSGAMVNRLWRHFLGVGLVEPVDDLRASNPPSNPELWQALVQDFVGHRFDLKHLMRRIVTSRTYQLASATQPANEQDNRFHSHFLARRLPAEVLLDGISQATGVPEPFQGYPVGVRAIQVPDPAVKSYFLEVFGRPQRVTACACERADDVTLPQVLHLFNSNDLVRKIQAPEGRLAGLLRSGKTDDEVMEELYLATLSRRPGDKERDAMRQHLLKTPSRNLAFADLMWALCNTKEFAFNH
jgi:hypothetical protein